MDRKQEFLTIVKIVMRAERMGIGIGTRTTRIIDMEFANKQFNLRLDEFLHADDFDFTHDFCGIQRNMNREKCRVENFFLPRFSMNVRNCSVVPSFDQCKSGTIAQ